MKGYSVSSRGGSRCWGREELEARSQIRDFWNIWTKGGSKPEFEPWQWNGKERMDQRARTDRSCND